jgi:hypothetical protein
MIGAPAILQSDNGREFSGAAGRKSVQLSDEVSAARCPVSAHLVAKPVAQFANQSPSLQTSRPVCKPVAQFANQSPSLQTSRPVCKPVAQLANQSPSLQTSRPVCKPVELGRPFCKPVAQFAHLLRSSSLRSSRRSSTSGLSVTWCTAALGTLRAGAGSSGSTRPASELQRGACTKFTMNR